MNFAGAMIRADEFHAPGPGSFELPPVFELGSFGVTKPMLLLVLSALVVVGFSWLAARRAAVVPGRLQFAGESVYNFVRGLARDNIGSDHFMKFVPYLFSLFLFILMNNYYGLIPVLQFPSFSRIGFVIPLAILSWLIYIGAGMWAHHGPLRYLKHQTVPGGIRGPILLLLVPLEFFSNLLVRPVTLTLRLFGNMFAGHLLLILFATGGAALLSSGNALYGGVGVLAFVLGIGVSFLEMLVMFLQAYVFTLLSTMYIGEAIAEEH